ncbi:MAG TPA: matrixin family metalloprotease [Phycisphaerae bacterium]|nr:matrixin family metalloprotease [Phycisphaerae bacterium]
MQLTKRVAIATVVITLGLGTFSVFGADGESLPDPYQLGSRWSITATNGWGLGQGDPTTIRWGFLQEETSIPAAYPDHGQVTGPSNLISSLDAQFEVVLGGSDLTQRPWFQYFSSSFTRMSEVCGLTEVYEPNDDGAPFYYSSGSTGVRGDVRIGGTTIDGGYGILAYNYYPNTGDMVIDTADMSYFDNSYGNFLRLRNMLMHEHGHGVGIGHVESSDSQFLLEPYINTNFDGPQFDDVLALHRHYGDANEKANAGAGNDTHSNATDFGAVAFGQTVTIGADATDKVVASTDIDFVSIDDNSDTDFFSFTVSTGASVSLTVTPLGPTYMQGPQGKTQTSFDSSSQSDLTLELLDSDGTALLALANSTGLGSAESLEDIELFDAGTYFVKITGNADEAQLYQMDMTVTPEPATLSLLAMGALAIFRRRKSR